MDVRLNVLAFQEVYTYFLGCLDVIKISFDVYKFCFCDGDDDDKNPEDILIGKSGGYTYR